MISCDLMGGMGNQLFQIFATVAYGIRKKKPFIFKYSKNLNERITYWNSFLDRLDIFTTNNPIYKDIRIDNLPTYRESGFQFTDIPHLQESFKLYGYFQSYKYFENEYDRICSMIQLKEKQAQIREEYLYLFDGKTHVISMHFRLGDYKTKPDCHNLLPYEYYEKALHQFSFNVPQEGAEMNGFEQLLSASSMRKGVQNIQTGENTRVLYFCEKEDNQTVLLNIELLRNKFQMIEFVKVDDSVPDWKQMLIMSCCHDNIIANSSFSWWGAYFNSNPNKKVCYPSIWFGPTLSYNDTKDMYPDSWKRITF